MAITYNGTDVSSVPDKPVGYSQTPIVGVSAPNYQRTYTVSVAKTTVDTADDVTNFTALVAAVDAAITADLADFDATNTVTASGRVSSFNLNGGTKYDNTTNTGSYTCDVITNITVV